MTTTLIGYARVSTTDQDASLQIDALKDAGCDRIFTDKASGAKASRPELDKMLDHLRAGDVVVVWKLDRLGRSVQNLVELVNRLGKLEVGFKSLTEQIDTTTSQGKLVFHIFASMAEFERDLIRERTNAGLKAARARGRVGGRPKALTPEKAKQAQTLYDNQTPVAEIARTLHVGVATIYRNLKALESV
jgi:DNA invertase Pin-like site-specific DNA recombinase